VLSRTPEEASLQRKCPNKLARSRRQHDATTYATFCKARALKHTSAVKRVPSKPTLQSAPRRAPGSSDQPLDHHSPRSTQTVYEPRGKAEGPSHCAAAAEGKPEPKYNASQTPEVDPNGVRAPGSNLGAYERYVKVECNKFCKQLRPDAPRALRLASASPAR
jgi:hypothetical protein